MTDLDPEAEARRKMENLRAVLEGPPAAARNAAQAKRHVPEPGAPRHPSHWLRNTLGTVGLAIVFLAGKLKFLGVLLSVLKLKTLATMVLSIGVYAIEWGWPFAAGFVLLIFVHELGHVIVLKREGIPAGAPVFIPFIGALIAMKGMPRDAYVEAKVGIGGPVLGSLAAWATLAMGLALERPILVTLGHAGILLNLFNLIPVSPLDGGRIAGAFNRTFWIAGYAIGVLALVVTRSPMLLLILVIGLFTLWRRLRHPVPGYDAIPTSKRLLVGLGYAVLVIALVMTLPVGTEMYRAGR